MEDIDVDDVIAFCFYVMNKMRRNLIKLRSCAYNSWFNRSDRFSSNFKVDKRLGFRLVDYKIRNVVIA